MQGLKSLLGQKGAEAPAEAGLQPFVSRARASARGLLALATLAACAHQSAPQGPPPPEASRDSTRADAAADNPDPVGFLLEYHDSLGIAPDQLDALRSINLDLFRRNARLQIAIDSIAPPAAPEAGYGRQSAELSDEQRARLRQLVTVRAANVRRARADADSVLTPDQRSRAAALERRLLRLRRPARQPRP